MSLWEKFKTRSLIYGTSSALAVVLVAGSLVLVILLGNRFSLRWDLTRNQTHSLSAVSQNLLKEVNQPLTLTVFYPEGHADRQRAREVLEMFVHANPQVSYRFLDPEKNPVQTDEAGARHLGNILIEYDGRRQMAERPEEEAVSEAIRRVLKKERKNLFFLTGHGERGAARTRRGFQVARKALQNEGYEVADLNLLTDPEVPKDAAVVILAAPTKDLLPQEVTALKAYLKGGGRLFLMLEPFSDAGLKDFLAGYGVNLDNGIVMEYNKLAQDKIILSPIVKQFGSHRITQDFAELAVIFPSPRPLLLDQQVKEAAIIPLAQTSASSWAKLGKEWLKENKINFDAKQDKKGPFIVAVLVEPKAEQKTGPHDHKEGHRPSYLAVFGDADFAADEYFNFLGNGDLFLNTVNFLAAEDKQIFIRKDPAKPDHLLLTGWHTLIIFVVVLILLPLAMLTAGVTTYVRRRRARR